MQNQALMFFWILFIVTSIIVMMNSSTFSFIDKIDDRPLNQLDGLRAILAILVVFHHFFFNYFYSKGEWVIEGYYFFSFIGKFAVGMFFILSGYLFSNISTNNLSWWFSFYKKRVLRIVPLTIVSSLACLFIAYIYGPQSKENITNIINWFDGGIFNQRNPLFGLNHSNIINSGVTWTLFWEWRLYFTLPLISLMVPIKKRLKISAAIAIASFLFYLYTKILHSESDPIIYVAVFFFSAGFFSRHLNSSFIKRISSRVTLQILVSAFFFVLPFAGKLSGAIYPLFAFIMFLMICNGCSFFGLLNLRGVKRIGVISYSVYLLHGIFWYVGFKVFISESNLLATMPLVFFMIILTSIFASCWIEYPIYKISKRPPKISISTNTI